MADGTVKIDVILDDGKIVKGVADIDKSLGGLGGSAQKSALSIGKIASALGLVYLAKKGIDMVRASVDGAITRFDTLNQFPRVMEMIGFDAESSSKAIQRLSDGVQGLPTRLDSVASTAQNIAVMTNDLDGAVETTLALNNAFLASGASTHDAERGLQQYVQMLSKGEVDLQSWRTLQETMGVALNQLAEDFGFTGKSAQTDLYDALKSGEITFDDFNAKLIEASTRQGGFADMALVASEGIRTSWSNIQTAFVNGTTRILEEIDKLLGGTGDVEEGFTGIVGVLEWFKESVYTAFDYVVAIIPVVASSLKTVYDILKPWLPLITSIISGIIAFTTVIQIINSVQTAITTVKTAFTLLNAVILANPIALVVAAIVAAAALIYIYWDPIKEFFLDLWEEIKELGLSIWDSLKEGWQNAKDSLIQAWDNVKDFFSNLWDSVKDISSNIWNAIVTTVMAIIQPFINGITNIFNNMKDGLSKIFDGLKQYFSGVWDLIKNIFLGAVILLYDLVTGNFEDLRSNATAIFENIKNALKNIWEGIKTIFSGALSAIFGLVKGVWQNIKSNTVVAFNAVRNTISSIWNNIKTFFTQTLVSLITTARQKFEEINSTIRSKLTNAVKIVAQKIGEMPGKVREKVSQMLNAGRDLIEGLINGIKQKAQDAIKAVTGVVEGAVNKAKELLGIKSPSRVFAEMGAAPMITGDEEMRKNGKIALMILKTDRFRTGVVI